MAQAARKKKRTGRQAQVSGKKTPSLPFTSHNYILFFAGIAVLILGYISMSIGPVDSFWSLTLAPVLLVIGYLIIIPFSFLYQHKKGGRTANRESAKQQTKPFSSSGLEQ